MATRVVAALTASAGGVYVVSRAGEFVETLVPPPPFNPSSERFDVGSFRGRWFNMLRNFDPSTLLHTNDRVREAVERLEEFELGVSKLHDEDLWAELKIKNSAVHPDTHEIIPQPFRMSGYTPFNGPVCVAMILATSTKSILFWNWVNQSQNALVNYNNRNASSEMSNETFAKSYAGAVGAALAVAFGASSFVKLAFAPATAAKLLTFVAFPSCVVASCSNAYIMRSPETITGIALFDESGREVHVPSKALSIAAAHKAVNETVISRAFLQIPTFFIPPMLMLLPGISAIAAASTLFNVTATSFLTTTAFGLGLPAAVAVFPQTGSISAAELEPEYKEECEKRNISVLYYNKGL